MKPTNAKSCGFVAVKIPSEVSAEHCPQGAKEEAIPRDVLGIALPSRRKQCGFARGEYRLAAAFPLGVEPPDVPSLERDTPRTWDRSCESTYAEQIKHDSRRGARDRIAKATLDTVSDRVVQLTLRASGR